MFSRVLLPVPVSAYIRAGTFAPARASALVLTLVLTLVVAAGFPAPARAQKPPGIDADAAKVPHRTTENILRWLPVTERELNCPVEKFRDIAREVAKGSTDSRILRSYHYLYPRLFPFDIALEQGGQKEARMKALAAMEALRPAAPGAAPPLDWSWQNLGPRNIPGRMTAIALHPTDPSTVYTVGADGGVWKTPDLGVTWEVLSDFEPTLAMGALAIDPTNPSIIYAGTGEGNYSGDSLFGQGLMKSTDGGQSWSMEANIGRAFHDIVLDRRDTSRLWAATRDGLFLSTDAGASFLPAGGGLPEYDCTALIMSVGIPDIMMAGLGTGFSSGPEAGLWRTTDGGASWAQVPTFPSGAPGGRIALAQCKNNPSRMYGAVHTTSGGGLLGIWRSDDTGATWTQVGAPADPCRTYCWYGLEMAVDPNDPDVAYLGGVWIYRTRDGGVRWDQVDNQGPNSYVHVDQHDILAPAPDVVWSANDGGINVSTDQGDTWTYVGYRLVTAQYYHFTSDPTNDAYATGGTQDQGSHRYAASSDWDKILGSDGGYTAINWVDPQIWYNSTQFLWLYRSRNRGAGIQRIGAGIDGADRRGFIAPYILDRSDPNILYAGTTRLWKSTDQGSNFVDISPHLASGNGVISAIDNCRDAPLSIWVGTGDGDLWHSPDGGANWNDRTAGLPSRAITSVTAHPQRADTACLTVGGANQGHVYCTDDFGQTWKDRSAGLPNIHFNQVLMLDDMPDTLVAAADLGVYRSDDVGQSWRTYGVDLPNVAVDSLSYSSMTGTLRIGTHGRGAWQLTPPGSCVFPPRFAGLASASSVEAEGLCVNRLEWEAAVGTCPQAPGVSYNIYRDTDPFLIPGAASLLEAAVAGTDFNDTTASRDRVHFYIVKAEDGQLDFGGPANGGMEDPNIRTHWATAGDPFASGGLADDGGDSTGWLRSESWSIQDCANSTPGGQYSYHSAPRDVKAYLANSCAVLETPPFVAGPGAVLSYQAGYNLELEWDGVVVEITLDGGQSWLDLPPDGGYPGTLAQTLGNACLLDPTRGVFTGPVGNLAPEPMAAYSSSLDAFVGLTVSIRWMMTSDPGLEYDGFDLDDVHISNVTVPPGPAMGNVLLGFKDSDRPHFVWTDSAEATSYRLYHAHLKSMGARLLVGGAASGVTGLIDTTPRPEPVHYYRIHAMDGCVAEGP